MPQKRRKRRVVNQIKKRLRRKTKPYAYEAAHAQHRHSTWSKERIIKIIQFMQKRGRPINSNYVQIKLQRLYKSACRYFGNWPKAIAAAGLDYSLVYEQSPPHWSQASIIAEIICRSKAGLSIAAGDVSVQDASLYAAARSYFGKRGWAKARVQAGFTLVDGPRVWNKTTVCAEILRLYESGAALNTAALARSRILSAAIYVYGSWRKAIHAAGLDYSKIRKGPKMGWLTKARVIKSIQSLEKRGVRLSHNTIRDTRKRLHSAAISRFGSWSEAVEAAGISYREHCRIWSTKAWLRRMEKSEYDKVLERAQTHAKKRSKR